MLLRVASFINMGDLEMTQKTYDAMSNGNYTHASPLYSIQVLVVPNYHPVFTKYE